jgi:RHS repeat-associated protein
MTGTGSGAPCLAPEHYPPGQKPPSTGIATSEFRYTGEQWDPNAGLYYLRARWMEPTTGRFSSVDPLVGDRLSALVRKFGDVSCGDLAFLDVEP